MKLEIAVEDEQQQEYHEEGERQDDAQLAARGGVFLVFAAPHDVVSGRKPNGGRDLSLRSLHGAGEVAAVYGVLDADEAAVVLPIDERRAVRHLDVGQILERDMLAVRGGDEDAADLLRVLAILRLEAHDEVVEALALLHLRGDAPADRRLNEGIDIAGVDTVSRDPGAIDRDRERRLAKLLDERQIADAAHVFENLLDLFPFALEDGEIGAEQLDVECALESRLGFVDGVFGGLRVIERDAREGL